MYFSVLLNPERESNEGRIFNWLLNRDFPNFHGLNEWIVKEWEPDMQCFYLSHCELWDLRYNGKLAETFWDLLSMKDFIHNEKNRYLEVLFSPISELQINMDSIYNHEIRNFFKNSAAQNRQSKRMERNYWKITLSHHITLGLSYILIYTNQMLLS